MVKTVISCVSENQPSWFDRVFNLALSVRSFGATLSDTPVVVNFVDGVEPRFEGALSDLDVTVNVVKRFDPRFPYANKLRMLELAKDMDFDVLVALDCDVIVMGDVTPLVSPEVFRAKPADWDFLTPEHWRRIFAELDLRAPERKTLTTTSMQRTYPYFNSGVLFVPHGICSGLLELWSGLIYELGDFSRKNPDVTALPQHTDQIGLACALLRGGYPTEALPVNGNFPTHINVHAAFLRRLSPPFVIHYHHSVDGSGFIQATKYRVVNEHLDMFNRRRAEALGLPYAQLPVRPLGKRLRQELRSQRWFQANPTKRLRRRARRVLSSVRTPSLSR